MFTQVLYRVCSPSGAFWEGVRAHPFRVNLPQKQRAAWILSQGLSPGDRPLVGGRGGSAGDRCTAGGR